MVRQKTSEYVQYINLQNEIKYVLDSKFLPFL